MIFEKSDNRNQDLILAISLGSKSSAMLTRSDGSIIGAFKEEHFTGVKNDSSFPVNSIINLFSTLSSESLYMLTVTITHWFNSKHSDKTWERYYVDIKEFINNAFPHHHIAIKKIIEANDLHNCLCETARSYVLSKEIDLNHGKPITIIVANRFGNFENVASTYKWEDYDSFLNGEDPEINKLKDFKSSIGMMQQIASKLAGYLEYDVTRGLLTLEHDEPIRKVSRKGLSLYGKQDDWYEYDRYKEPILFDNTKKTEDLINRAIRKTRDVDDYRPLNVKKLDQLNEHYIEFFKDMDIEKLTTYVQDKSYQALSNLIFPHKDGHVILIGDAFASDKVNEKLKHLYRNQMIFSPLLEDNMAIFGATSKILEKIYYNRLDLKDINVGNRYIDIPKYDESKFESYDIKMSCKKAANYVVKNTLFINSKNPDQKDFNTLVSWVMKGNIVNILDNSYSLTESILKDSLSSISVSVENKRDQLMTIASDCVKRISYHLTPDTGNRILDDLIESCYSTRLVCTSFVNFDNITPINTDSATHAFMNQMEKRDFHNLSNEINLVVII
jgi:hypothetical protein